ncbi:unnamed protein product [Arabis nemorensis]|uniref:RRM domain-containing protein n=1 Tax=Arabis nemorensis TaxID=586526 RepID=A0A565BMP9_9BRAS|nr:unnamed protein product [Arabis nemorensis]
MNGDNPIILLIDSIIRGEHVGSGFVEFASAYSALMAMERKNDHKNRTFFLDVVKTAPYPLRPK